MRAEIDWVTAVGIGRIQDKTRWTKALGEAATVGYGDCYAGSEPNKHCRGGDCVTSGPHSIGPVTFPSRASLSEFDSQRLSLRSETESKKRSITI